MRRKTGRPFHGTDRNAGASSALPPRNQKSGQISQICALSSIQRKPPKDESWGFANEIPASAAASQAKPQETADQSNIPKTLGTHIWEIWPQKPIRHDHLLTLGIKWHSPLMPNRSDGPPNTQLSGVCRSIPLLGIRISSAGERLVTGAGGRTNELMRHIWLF